MATVERFVGVYHADGGLRGEAAYVFGKLLGKAHCALCDITHSPVRRKPAWDAMVARLGVPFNLVHRNEWPRSIETPVVLGFADGAELVLLRPADLELHGSVQSFDAALRAAVAGAGLQLPATGG